MLFFFLNSLNCLFLRLHKTSLPLFPLILISKLVKQCISNWFFPYVWTVQGEFHVVMPLNCWPLLQMNNYLIGLCSSLILLPCPCWQPSFFTDAAGKCAAQDIQQVWAAAGPGGCPLPADVPVVICGWWTRAQCPAGWSGDFCECAVHWARADGAASGGVHLWAELGWYHVLPLVVALTCMTEHL